MFDLVVQKEKYIFNKKHNIFDKNEEDIRLTLFNCADRQKNLIDAYFEICKKNREKFVNIIFNPKNGKNYFLGLLHYITKKTGALLDNLNTFGDIKQRLINTTKHYEQVDPEGEAAYGLMVFLSQTKNLVFTQVHEAIADKKNTGIINNLNSLYNTLNTIGYTGIKIDLKILKHIKSEKVNAIVEIFKVYIDIIHRLLNKLKRSVTNFLQEFTKK